MYRLINFRKMNLSTLNSMSFVSNALNRNPLTIGHTCHLCKQLHVLQKVFVRSRSTNPDPVISHRPKKIRKPKKYAELLVVTENSSREKKASIKKLNPRDFSVLALQPSVGLGELHKIKALSKKVNTNLQTVIETVSAMSNIKNGSTLLETENNDLENEALDHEFSAIPLMEEMEGSATDEYDIEAHKDEIYIKSKDKLSKEIGVMKTLCAYVEVLNGLKQPEKALVAVIACRSHSQRSNNGSPLKFIQIYNSLLKGFAAKGDVENIELVLKMIKEEELNLNIKSYAAILECFGNCEENEYNRKLLLEMVENMQKQGITFNKIMNHALFSGNQRETVLKTIRSIDENYEPHYFTPRVQYKCSPLETLNHPQQLNLFSSKFAKPIPDNQPGDLFKSGELSDLILKQLDIEKEGYVTIKSIDTKPKITDQVIQYREAFDRVMKKWEAASLNAFNRDLAVLKAKYSLSQYSIIPYLQCLSPEIYIKIILSEVKKLAQGSESYSPTVSQLHRQIGQTVYSHYRIIMRQQLGILEKVLKIHEDYCTDYANTHRALFDIAEKSEPFNFRQKWQAFEFNYRKEGPTVAVDHHVWPPTVLLEIGKFLYNIIMYDLKIDVNIMKSKHKNNLPAFYTVFRSQGRIIKEEIKPHPVLTKLYRNSQPETLTFLAQEVPMKCPPVPWTCVTNGGYLVAHSEVVRLPNYAFTQKQRMLQAPLEELYPSLDSLNQLAAVPWQVNQNVLDVILAVFKTGGSSRLDVPEPPSVLPAAPPITPDMDKSQRFTVFKQKLQLRRRKAEMYSLWCDTLYRLSLANHFRNEIFWLPHNMDFRGRVYPVPPHLNHLGSDLARSILVFAEKRPLGPEGLNWLKIHAINLTGLKKKDSIADRLLFAEEILPKIKDSAEKPLDGEMWWSHSDEPWQTLACCMEIAAAIKSGDPENFRSGFPVHQDGSCNGLQHYAALGRDYAGARSVNLISTPKPQDVYSAVAELVEKQRAADEAMGHEIAKALNGFVRRKVIKQTVMTTVYGVTRYGARLQIAKQLKDIEEFPKDYVWSASSYLTSRTFESLRTMFTSTREIQDWFTECARLISAVSGQNVEWVTPLGLPVVQPYHRFKKYDVVKSGSDNRFAMDMYEKPNVMKQKNAFPPNFIHSLDSSHMMLTSLFSERAGITFVSVHDCYWTHPATVHIMNKICREQFVALHSMPILEDLSNFLSDKYSYSDDEITDDGSVTDLTRRKLNRALRMLPKTGDFDINEVLNSVYFFS